MGCSHTDEEITYSARRRSSCGLVETHQLSVERLHSDEEGHGKGDDANELCYTR